MAPMMVERWVLALRALAARPLVRSGMLLLYYLAILAGLILLYGRGDFSTPRFIYQGF
jgi:hypothetical protein